MTVSELIVALQQSFDPSALVVIDTIGARIGIYPASDQLADDNVDMDGEEYACVVLTPTVWP